MPLPVPSVNPLPSITPMVAWPSDWYSICADTLGILGFFVTLFLTQTTWQLKRHLEQKKRLPQLVKTISAHCAFLETNTPLFPACRFAAKIENGKIIGNLIALKRELGWLEGHRVKSAMKAIRVYEKTENEKNLESVCACMNTLLTMLEQKVLASKAEV